MVCWRRHQRIFDNINHDVLINILKERIADDRFIRLIRKLLKAGYIEDWKFHRTYSGTPQGGIVSPLLANIYLDKLDKYMKEYIQDFDKGKNRKRNQASCSLGYKRRWIVHKLKRRSMKLNVPNWLRVTKRTKPKACLFQAVTRWMQVTNVSNMWDTPMISDWDNRQ